MGGYWLPKRYGRAHPGLGTFLAKLLRGVACHGVLLLFAATLLMLASGYAGVLGVVTTSVAISFLLLYARVPIAQLTSQLTLAKNTTLSLTPFDYEVIDVHCEDEGFTGGIAGVLRPRSLLVPNRWHEALGSEGMKLAVNRRALATKTGSWLRGRL